VQDSMVQDSMVQVLMAQRTRAQDSMTLHSMAQGSFELKVRAVRLPVGLSMVTRLAPVKLASLLMGVWFLSSFVANIIGGFVASYASRMGAMSIFITIAAISVMLGLLLISMNKWLFKKSHGTL
jgi:MFS family permease